MDHIIKKKGYLLKIILTNRKVLLRCKIEIYARTVIKIHVIEFIYVSYRKVSFKNYVTRRKLRKVTIRTLLRSPLDCNFSGRRVSF